MFQEYRITTVTAPAIEPVTIDEIKSHLRIDHDDDDVLLQDYILFAREFIEERTGQALITQTLDIEFDGFGNPLDLPKPPLQSVTSVTYLDDAGDSQVLATNVYRVDDSSMPGSIALDIDQSWPTIYPVKNCVAVRVLAGYGDTRDAVPMRMRQALKLLVGHLHGNREATIGEKFSLTSIPFGLEEIINQFIVDTI